METKICHRAMVTAGVGVCLGLTKVAGGAVIYQPADVVFDTGTDISPISRMIDQSGLSMNYTSGVTDAGTFLGAATVATNSQDNMWFSESGVTSGGVIFDLGTTLNISEFYFWGRDGSGQTPKSVELFTASSLSDFSGGVSILDFDISISGGGDINVTQGQTFSFAETSTRYVRLQITDNHGATIVGAGEAAFGGPPVPEPSSLLFSGAGLIGLLLFRRRRFS